MKFSINRQKTIEIIGEYSNILKDNPVKPSLAGLFIQAKNNQVVFKGANTEIELIRYANCDIESEGQVLIKPALLLEYIKLIEEENINIFSYPVKKKDKFLQINIEDNFITYQKGLNDVYMTFDDCILIGERNDWGICTNIDREVLFLGYTVLFNNFVSTIFQYNDFVLNKKEVETIYNDNVWH